MAESSSSIFRRAVVANTSAAATTALLWIGAFYLNQWLFAAATKTRFVSLVFLPAGVRILAVLIFGWSAAIGLFIGSVVTATPIWHLPAALVPDLISALGPAAAVFVGTHSLQLRDDLGGIGLRQVAMISSADGAFNAVPSNVFFWWQHRIATPWQDVLPMFAGDLIGTFIMLYLGALTLRLLLRARAGRP